MVDITEIGDARFLQMIGGEKPGPAGAQNCDFEILGNGLARREGRVRVLGIDVLELAGRADILVGRRAHDALVALRKVTLPQGCDIDGFGRGNDGGLAAHDGSDMNLVGIGG